MIGNPIQKQPDQPAPPRALDAVDLWLPRLAALAGCIFFLAHCLRAIFGSEFTVMEWLYDDCFYYMIPAMHFSERHISSFDGVTVTTGYHPLWMWLCALVYGLRGRLDLTYVRCCMALSSAISSTLLLVTLQHAWRHRRTGMLWALGLATCSYSALNNGLTVMEFPLVVLFWFLLHILLLREPSDGEMGSSRTSGNFSLFLVAAMGSLSRTDFGLIPASYLAAAVFMIARHRGNWSTAQRALWATLGSAAGLLADLAYNHRMTGAWLQSSAEVKQMIASLTTPFNPVPAAWQFLRVLLYLPPLPFGRSDEMDLVQRALPVLFVVLVLIAAFAVSRMLRRRTSAHQLVADAREPHRELSILASSFGVAGYLLLYGFNSQATYGWYSAAVTGFILLLAARGLATLRTAAAAAIVLPLMLASITFAHHFGGNARGQMLEVDGGKALHTDHPSAIMGGGDVGKPSFYNNGIMFNLDGLMNNEVLPYLAAGNIQCYVLRKRMEYVYNVGSVTYTITNLERAKHGQTRMPWNRYFTPVYAGRADGLPVYVKVDLAAIEASGDCSNR